MAVEVNVLKIDGTSEPLVIAPEDEGKYCQALLMEKGVVHAPPDTWDVLCDGVSVSGKPIKEFNGKKLVTKLKVAP